MSQEKAQLIAPQGHFTVPGLNVAGVVTASSFSGNCTGTASSIAQGTNVVVGVMTASSFAGDVFGNAAGLSTTTAGLKLGIVTATSFAGNFTGIGSGLTGTPNIVAGLVTASQFIGNTPGLAAGISAGKNLAAGIVTATTFYGDGSNLTGAGSTAFIRQSVSAAQTAGNTINLNDGNIVYLDNKYSTTLAFSNVKTADDLTIIRSLEGPSPLTTGAVDFGPHSQSIGFNCGTDFDFGTSDFTVEFFIKYGKTSSNQNADFLSTTGTPNTGNWGVVQKTGKLAWQVTANGSSLWEVDWDSTILDNQWHHCAIVRKSNTFKVFVDGVSQSADSGTFSDSTDYTGGNIGYRIGGGMAIADSASDFSNVRVVNGTAVYENDFNVPQENLSNITNTKLLCCQSDSSATTAAVAPNTITATSGSPTAYSATINNNISIGTITWPDSIIWNGGSAPTLLGANSYSLTGQVFNLVTVDSGTTWYGYEEVNSNNIQVNTLWGWGRNEFGEIGNNNRTYYSSPVQIPGTTWVWESNKMGYTYTRSHVLKKSDGTIWGWGSNNYSQLGQNNRTRYSSPTQIPGTTWAIGSNGQSSVWSKTDGTLWTWGQGAAGVLGHNQPASISISSPTQIPGGTWSTSNSDGMKLVISRAYPSISAIKTDGTLWSWGYGGKGMNGQGNNTYYSSPVQIPGTTWKTVAIGARSKFGIKTDGTLWSWGYGSYGQTGHNSETQYSSPKQVPGTTWASVAAGQNVTFATKTDGTLWAWGSNEYGQFGANLGHDQGRSSPVQIPGTTWNTGNFGGTGGDVVGGVLWTKTDGTLWAWGSNVNGVLGQNSQVQYSSPVQIPGTDWSGVSSIGYAAHAFKAYNP